jgi:AI-2 transport protein TqsA
MPSKTVTAQARPDCMPVAGQRPGPRFFRILIVAGLVVVGTGLRSTPNLVGPLFFVITLVITVAPLRNLLVLRRWPSWLANVISLLTIYVLLAIILGSVAFAVAWLVGTLPEYANAFNRIFKLPPRPQHSAWLRAGAARATGLLGPAE